jgi:hypothetical protein
VANRRQGDSIGGYFTDVFTRHPEFLRERKNDKLFEQWKKDHPGKALTQQIRNIAANVKSKTKTRLRIGKPGRKPKAAAVAAAAPRPARASSAGNLEKLELHIDECLSMARQLDEEAMSDIVKNLRVARNEVVRVAAHP